MANPSQNDAPKVFRINRFQIGLNVLIQFVALGASLLMVNYLAFSHYTRWDLSRDQKYALSDTTKRLLKNLKKPVKVIVFFTSASDIYVDIDSLLKEYQYSSRKKINVETVDPFRNLTRARALVAKYKLGANENLVILDYDGHSKSVNATDMADYDMSNAMYGQPPRLTAFKGEQTITSALLEITEDKQNKIHFLTGHGEPDLKTGSLTTFRTFLERQNLKIDTLNLMNVDKIPDDVKTILILGPKYDLSEREMALLQDYWNKKGRLFIALAPDAQTPRLSAFLAAQGVKPDDDRILRTVAIGPVTGVLRDVAGVFVEGSPITKRLRGVSTQFLGGTQSLTLDQSAPKTGNFHVRGLIEAAEGYWGEADYNAGEDAPIFFDPKRDKAPPLTIAASVEKGALSDERVQVDSSRMIVVGSSDFVLDQALTEANVDFALSGLNWMLDRQELVGISPKTRNAFSLNLTEPQITMLAWLTVGGFAAGFIPLPGAIPAIALCFGFAMWLERRR